MRATDGGRNPSYGGRFNDETPEMHLLRLAQARRIVELEAELAETKSFIAALQGLHAGDIETLKAERDTMEQFVQSRAARELKYEALLRRCSDACKVVPVLVRNGEHISLPMQIGKALSWATEGDAAQTTPNAEFTERRQASGGMPGSAPTEG